MEALKELEEKLNSGLETHLDRSKISILAFPRPSVCNA